MLNVTEDLFDSVEENYALYTNWVSWVRTILPLWPHLHSIFKLRSDKKLATLQEKWKIKVSEREKLGNWLTNRSEYKSLQEGFNCSINTQTKGDLLQEH